jgi:uncharacterized protein YhbP (UPF0306 family)
MSIDTRAAVRRLLQEQSAATLATQGTDGPWAATVFFASDEDLRLYFLSDPRTRHGRHLSLHPEAAVAVQPDCKRWAEIRGVQIKGQVGVLAGPERDAALQLYLAKFPDVAALLRAPRDADESKIARGLAAATLYCLAPSWLRLIDNSQGFGCKQEIVIGDSTDSVPVGRETSQSTPLTR